MARTRATARKISGGKASRKGAPKSGGSAGSSQSSGSSRRHESGNSYCPRETPAWQRQITNFLSESEDKENAGHSGHANDNSGPSSSA